MSIKNPEKPFGGCITALDPAGALNVLWRPTAGGNRTCCLSRRTLSTHTLGLLGLEFWPSEPWIFTLGVWHSVVKVGLASSDHRTLNHIHIKCVNTFTKGATTRGYGELDFPQNLDWSLSFYMAKFASIMSSTLRKIRKVLFDKVAKLRWINMCKMAPECTKLHRAFQKFFGITPRASSSIYFWGRGGEGREGNGGAPSLWGGGCTNDIHTDIQFTSASIQHIHIIQSSASKHGCNCNDMIAPTGVVSVR